MMKVVRKICSYTSPGSFKALFPRFFCLIDQALANFFCFGFSSCVPLTLNLSDMDPLHSRPLEDKDNLY